MDDINKAVETSLQLETYPPSQILRQISHPVEDFDGNLTILAEKMIDFMRKHKGIGLAAPQIGLLRRMIVIEIYHQSYCMANPEIMVASDWDLMEEGCLSLPGRNVVVRRNKFIKVQGLNMAGEAMTVLAAGLLARVFQHEIDHLNGVMICDYEA
ncbi:MAG: peptide deformylase [Sedimentisphaerales bacterium]|nr:peptide deformylase [Sedimentisphaerales bacterium]